MKTVDIESGIWRLIHENGVGWTLTHKPSRTTQTIPPPSYSKAQLAGMTERQFNIAMGRIFNAE